jgi:hypothetical protein
MSGAAKFRKSDARQFNKPIEFDHSLATAQQQHGDPTARGSQGGGPTLSSQLGLDSDSDGDEHNAFAAALDSNRALERRGAGAEGSTGFFSFFCA